jgi:uncharacterized protein (DUF2141 family)
MNWHREEYPYDFESGHCVTAAGVNSDTWEIALSDPIQDNAEPPPQGTNGAGRVYPPPPHPHPPVPPDTLHNDASFVSHDIYNAAPLPPDFPAGIASFGLMNYFSPQYPGQPLAVAEWAVIVSPLGVHDVAVTNVTSSKTVIGQGYTANITVKAENQGSFTETFNVTVYANTTEIETQEVTLTSGNSTTITFTWNTTGFVKGSYTISAIADTILGETDTADNTYNNGLVTVTIIGDVNGDGVVDIFDLVLVALGYGSSQGEPGYNPNADVNGDGIIDIFDLVLVAKHYGEEDC